MSAEASRIVNKLWSYCNILRDDGLSYGDYLEQLSVLLFLKLAHEQTQRPWNKPSPVPEGYDWPSLNALDGVALEQHFRATLEHLGRQHGLLGLVFRKAQNKIQVRRGAILHAATAHRRHRRGDEPPARREDHRPGLRHGRVLALGAPPHHHTLPGHPGWREA